MVYHAPLHRILSEPVKSYRRLPALGPNESERHFLERRLREVQMPVK
jgi:hypothetical protein